MMAGARFPLPARDRILVHLSDFGNYSKDEAEYPLALTQDGIAWRTGLGRAHVALALKSIREEGFVEEVKGRVSGEARRRKVYLLSGDGQDHTRKLLGVVMGSEIEVRREGVGPRRTKLSEASFLLEKKLPLTELALSVREGGVLILSADGSAEAPAAEKDDGAPPCEDDGQEAGASSTSSPAQLWKGGETTYAELPFPGPAVEYPGPHPHDSANATHHGGPGAAGAPARTAPSAMATAPVPPTGNPWRKRGQFAAVWIGTIFLAVMFLILGLMSGQLEFEMVITYFLVQVTLQWVLLGAKRIPASSRAELGIFLGGFLSIYGAFIVLGPAFVSLLWFTEGILLLSTGLLLHPLEPIRKFQTGAAAVGAFLLYLCGTLLIDSSTIDPILVAVCIPWILVGGLLLGARIFYKKQEYSTELRTATALSSGVLLITIGAFLASREMAAEGFVEVLVGLVILYYTAPHKREEWKRALIFFSAIMCVMVAITTFLVLSLVLHDITHLFTH